MKLKNRRVWVALAIAAAGLAGVNGAAAGDARGPVRVVVTPPGSSGVGWASGVPRQARDSSNNVEFIGCSVLRGAVITAEGEAAPAFPRPNQLVKCSARSAQRAAAACSTTDPVVVELMASVLASVTAESQLSFFFDAQGTCTHAEVGLHSQLLQR